MVSLCDFLEQKEQAEGLAHAAGLLVLKPEQLQAMREASWFVIWYICIHIFEGDVMLASAFCSSSLFFMYFVSNCRQSLQTTLCWVKSSSRFTAELMTSDNCLNFPVKRSSKYLLKYLLYSETAQKQQYHWCPLSSITLIGNTSITLSN